MCATVEMRECRSNVGKLEKPAARRAGSATASAPSARSRSAFCALEVVAITVARNTLVAHHRYVTDIYGNSIETYQELATLRIGHVLIVQMQVVDAGDVIQSVGFHGFLVFVSEVA